MPEPMPEPTGKDHLFWHQCQNQLVVEIVPFGCGIGVAFDTKEFVRRQSLLIEHACWPMTFGFPIFILLIFSLLHNNRSENTKLKKEERDAKRCYEF